MKNNFEFLRSFEKENAGFTFRFSFVNKILHLKGE